MDASSPENRKKLLNGNFGTEAETQVAGARIVIGSSEFGIDEAIQMHLIDCEQCHAATMGKPRGLGQKTGLCDTYLQMQLTRADFEGKVNNVVAYTEEGYEAPRGKPLQ